MKKQILTFSGLMMALGLNAQNVNIPDPVFKAALVNNSSINTNMEMEIQVSEANNFTGGINVGNKFTIADLKGIE